MCSPYCSSTPRCSDCHTVALPPATLLQIESRAPAAEFQCHRCSPIPATCHLPQAKFVCSCCFLSRHSVEVTLPCAVCTVKARRCNPACLLQLPAVASQVLHNCCSLPPARCCGPVGPRKLPPAATQRCAAAAACRFLHSPIKPLQACRQHRAGVRVIWTRPHRKLHIKFRSCLAA
jgi:hypothetical protein